MQENIIITKENFDQINQIQLKQIAFAYSSAFAREPWFEKTKNDNNDFSSASIGELCPMTGNIGTKEAYPIDETIINFRNKIIDQNGLLDTEFDGFDNNLMNYLSVPLTLDELIKAKYNSNQELLDELKSIKAPSQFVWVDEIFASFVRVSGNMYRFDEVIKQAQNYYQLPVCYRTINPKVITKTKDSFESSKIYNPINDNRTFLTISN